MPYCRLYYHLVWATHQREPLITPAIEEQVYSSLKSKAQALGGEVFAVDGVEEHVHFAGTIPAKISVAKFVGEIKGASSFHINHLPRGEHVLQWQRGYGAISLRKDDLTRVVEYIERQKQRHAEGNIWNSLEETSDEDAVQPGVVREASEEYDPFGDS